MRSQASPCCSVSNPSTHKCTLEQINVRHDIVATCINSLGWSGRRGTPMSNVTPLLVSLKALTATSRAARCGKRLGTHRILHGLQGSAHVRVAVVAAKVVHALAICPVRLVHRCVPSISGSHSGWNVFNLVRVELYVSCRVSECHPTLRANKVRTLKIADDALRVGDACVADERENPAQTIHISTNEDRQQYNQSAAAASGR